MILVDTSIWIDFLRHGDEHLAHLLTQNKVCMHSMIMGELACGHLGGRAELFKLWEALPNITQATHQEAIFLLNEHQLMGKGIGFIDLHLLAAVKLTANSKLWTRDKRLARIAEALHINFLIH